MLKGRNYNTIEIVVISLYLFGIVIVSKNEKIVQIDACIT